jgi:hypothetical protein
MEFGEVLIAMTAIIIGGATIMLPVFALTVRHVLRPMIDSWALMRQGTGSAELQRLMEQRISILESQVQSLERDCARLQEETDFQLKLRG